MNTLPIYDLVATKYDGVVYRVFTNNVLLKEDEEKFIFYSQCGSRFFNVRNQEFICSECDEFVVVMKKKFFNIIILLRENGVLEYYINLTLIPNAPSGNAIKYADMDIDLSFTSVDRNIKVLDLDEFEHNARIYQYAARDKDAINAAVESLKMMVADGHYYFSEVFAADCQALLQAVAGK